MNAYPYDELTLWALDHGPENVTLEELIARGDLAPGAYSARLVDVIHQHNETNGGEVWITERDEPAPWIARRTAPEPEVGAGPRAFYVETEREARAWLDAGQVDVIEQASR